MSVPVPAALLFDALDRTLQVPGDAHRWHRLAALCAEATDGDALRRIGQTLIDQPEGEAHADILRWTFLAGTTGDRRFDADAAARQLTLASEDAEWLAAFMAYVSLDALQRGDGRAAFVDALRTARLPELAARLAQFAAAAVPAGFAARAPRNVERVAIIVPYLGNRFHTPGAQAVAQAGVLARAGCRVRLFSAQELEMPQTEFFRGDAGRLSLPPLDAEHWIGALPSGVTLSVADSRFSLRRRWQDMLPLLAEFDPDAVLLVGLYSPMAAALHALRPVVALNVHGVAPIAPADVWLSAAGADEMQQAARVWGDAFPPPQPRFHPWRLAGAADIMATSTSRSRLGLDDDALLWITVGFRLEHEIAGEWAKRMLDALAREPRAVWLLVGGNGALPSALRAAAGADPAIAARLRTLATRSDVPDLLRLSDISVNPPRMGGGFSVAEAMAAGLPVLAFAGSDGGDKVGDQAVQGMDAYFDRLAALSANPELRAEAGDALRRRFAAHYDLAASGPALRDAVHQAAALAAGRLTTPAS